jgi:peroxin-16
MSGYESWLSSNQSWVLPIIDAARSLTLFLPGRFSESQIQSEGIYTALNCIQLLHDNILNRPRQVTAELKYDPNLYFPSLNSQPLNNKFYRNLQHVLTIFHYTEVLLEMMATRYFDRHPHLKSKLRNKYSIILLIELIKAICRLSMLYKNHGRILLPPTQNELHLQAGRRAREKAKQSRKATEHSNTSGSAVAEFDDLIDIYVNHGRGKENPHGNYNLNLTLHPMESSAYKPSQVQVLAEILHIIRPVIYVAAKLYFDNNSNPPISSNLNNATNNESSNIPSTNLNSSWHPWLLSLFVDILSRSLQRNSANLSPAQRVEISRRTLNWGFYLLRSPMFDSYTQFPLLRISDFLQRLPLLGGLLSSLIDLIFQLQHHYFYISAS